MYSKTLYTPLRYPGGKARFAPFIADIISSNGLTGGHYLEPYAGGAGVALILLFDGHVSQVHVNDVDPAVAVFWRAATTQASRLINKVANEPVTLDAWRHWRSVMLGESQASELDRGFATLFMNRTNRSGILKGGVIGGKDQAGSYKLDARFMRDQICARLERIGAHSSAIQVYEEDAQALLLRAHRFLPMKSLVYLDPPYYVKGSGLYRNYYKQDDHKRIAKLLGGPNFRRPWIVSYDNVSEIRSMYEYARSFAYDLNYTAQRRYMGGEVMFFSDRLTLPQQIADQCAA